MQKDLEQVLIRIEDIKSAPHNILTTLHNKTNITTTLSDREAETLKPFLELLSYISKQDLDKLPESLQTRFYDMSHQIVNIYHKTIFGKSDLEPIESVKQQILSLFNPNGGAFEDKKYALWNLVTLSLAINNNSDLTELIEKAKTGSNEIIQVVDNAKRILDDLKDEVKEKGISVHQALFNTQAGKHEENARKWLYGILGITTTIIVGLIIVFCILMNNKNLTVLERIQTSIFSTAIITILSYGLTVCTRNYISEKHNQTINRHKANCLGTFNTFVDTADTDSKQELLRQVTSTIFSHQNAGFLVKGSNDTNNINLPIIELLKNSRP